MHPFNIINSTISLEIYLDLDIFIDNFSINKIFGIIVKMYLRKTNRLVFLG